MLGSDEAPSSAGTRNELKVTVGRRTGNLTWTGLRGLTCQAAARRRRRHRWFVPVLTLMVDSQTVRPDRTWQETVTSGAVFLTGNLQTHENFPVTRSIGISICHYRCEELTELIFSPL